MDKEKLISVIEQNRDEVDEREKLIKISSFTWGYSGCYVALVINMVIRLIAGEEFLNDLMMILMGQVGFMSLYMYINKRNTKLNLFFSILSLILFLYFMYTTVVHYGLI